MRSRPCLFALLVFIQAITMIARAQSTTTVTQRQSRDTLVLHFGFNQDILRKQDSSRLGRLFQDNDRIIDTLVIAGYTDTVGTIDYNQKLSLRRARATTIYLKQLAGDVSPPATTIQGFGETDPIAGSDSLNRRVRVVVIYRYVPTSSPAPTLSAPTPSAPQPDTLITLTDINFIEDSPNLTEASRMIIPEYIRMLQRYKSDSLEIDGYCHSQTPITSTSDPLFKLSVKRAKLIYDYLVDEGFDRTKLSYKGMGNARPKNEHPVTAEEARANMRVEIRVFHKKQ